MFSVTRQLWLCLFSAILLLVSHTAQAASIFEMRKSLPLDPSEQPFHDYYINAGSESGLKRGVYLNVVRMTPVTDPAQNRVQGTLGIPVGKIMIIHVEKNLSVGRSVFELADDERPVLEFEGIMIGDQVDLESTSTDVPKRKNRRGVAVKDASSFEAIRADVNRASDERSSERVTERLADKAAEKSTESPSIESTKPDAARGALKDPSKLDATKSDSAKLESPKLETQKTDAPKSESTRSTAAGTEVQKAERAEARKPAADLSTGSESADSSSKLPSKLPQRRARAMPIEQTT